MRHDEVKSCRICLSDEGHLKCRCQCKNDVYHDECIIKWINIKKSSKCEICNAKYVGVIEDKTAFVTHSIIKETITLQFCFFIFNFAMWSLYLTMNKPNSCKLKDNQLFSYEKRAIYKRGCDNYYKEMRVFLITNLILTAIFIIFQIILCFPDKFNLVEYAYKYSYKIDNKLIFAKLDELDEIDEINNELDNEIIETHIYLRESSSDDSPEGIVRI